MNPNDTERCFSSHMGEWAAEPRWLNQAVAAVRGGFAPELDPSREMAIDPMAQGETVRASAGGRYTVDQDGVAVVRLVGSLQKGMSKFGDGTSTIAARSALRAAVADERVRGIVIATDSPGGTVSGTPQLAEDIAIASANKPTVAFVDDLAASGAYWAASQTARIIAIPSADIGSIGVMAVLEDTSGKMEREGVQVHVITTGEQKAIGADGVPVLPEHLAIIGDRIAEKAEMFFAAVQGGRALSDEQMAEIKDGRVMSASAALEAGLIDEIGTFEDARAYVLAKSGGSRKDRRARADAAMDKLR